VFPEFGELWFTLRGAKILTADIFDIFVGAQPYSATLGLAKCPRLQSVGNRTIIDFIKETHILSPTMMFVVSIL